jgi:heme A synthase
VLAQLALGAGFRHRAFGVLPHIIGALVVTTVIFLVGAFILAQFNDHAILRRCAWALMGVTLLQVMLGIAALMARLSVMDAVDTSLRTVVLTVLHVATGALTMAATVALSIQVFRNVRPREAEVPSGNLRTAS